MWFLLYEGVTACGFCYMKELQHVVSVTLFICFKTISSLVHKPVSDKQMKMVYLRPVFHFYIRYPMSGKKVSDGFIG